MLFRVLKCLHGLSERSFDVTAKRVIAHTHTHTHTHTHARTHARTHTRTHAHAHTRTHTHTPTHTHAHTTYPYKLYTQTLRDQEELVKE